MKTVNVLGLREREEWDDFISVLPDSTFYDTYDWAEILRAGAGITPYFLGFWKDKELAAVWPSFIIPAFGGNVLSFHSASTNFAPLVKDGDTLECLNDIVEYVCSDATKRYDILHWSFDAPTDSYFTNFADVLGFSSAPSPRCTYTLDTTFTSDVLWKKLAWHTRRDIRIAKQSSLEVKISAESDDIATFLSIYQSTMERRHATGFRHPDSLLPLLIRLESEQKMKLFVATDDGNLVAGVLLLLHKKTVHGWLGGSYQESWGLRPNELLMWSIVEWASESGYHNFDLGASPSDQARGYWRQVYGLNTFKRRLGAEKSELVRFTLPVRHHLKDVVCTKLVNAYTKGREWGLVPRLRRLQ